MTHLTIIRGIPGSGKSSLALEILKGCEKSDVGVVFFEADQYFMEDGVYNWDINKIRCAHQWCQSQTLEHLNLGYHVIVSNTFTTKKELKPYFNMIHSFRKNPAVICMQSEWGSTHSVPQDVMDNMRKRFTFDISDMFKEF